MVVKAGTCRMSVRECFVAFQTFRELHTSQVFPSRAPAGKKETGNTEPLGDQGGQDDSTGTLTGWPELTLAYLFLVQTLHLAN